MVCLLSVFFYRLSPPSVCQPPFSQTRSGITRKGGSGLLVTNFFSDYSIPYHDLDEPGPSSEMGVDRQVEKTDGGMRQTMDRQQVTIRRKTGELIAQSGV